MGSINIHKTIFEKLIKEYYRLVEKNKEKLYGILKFNDKLETISKLISKIILRGYYLPNSDKVLYNTELIGNNGFKSEMQLKDNILYILNVNRGNLPDTVGSSDLLYLQTLLLLFLLRLTYNEITYIMQYIDFWLGVIKNFKCNYMGEKSKLIFYNDGPINDVMQEQVNDLKKGKNYICKLFDSFIDDYFLCIDDDDIKNKLLLYLCNNTRNEWKNYINQVVIDNVVNKELVNIIKENKSKYVEDNWGTMCAMDKMVVKLVKRMGRKIDKVNLFIEKVEDYSNKYKYNKKYTVILNLF